MRYLFAACMPFFLVVACSDGGSDDPAQPIGNMAPQAAFTSPTTADERSSFNASAGGSSDPDGMIVSYSWSIVNTDQIDITLQGEDTENLSISVGEIQNSADIQIMLSVTDDLGESASASSVVSINEVDAQLLPPMPNEQDSLATVAGIDTDGDGVRDDVERSILGLYPLNTPRREVLLIGASAIQMQVMAGNDGDQAESDAASERSADFAACALSSGSVETVRQDLAALKLFTLNTDARRQAYLDYEASRAGTIQRAVDPSLVDCTFEF
ncbi:MAG: PKD domain-containing protein [Hyphomonadaceae bacterium]|nr:PKD domain-containing protein [Hyphomonadaceae bacterium]